METLSDILKNIKQKARELQELVSYGNDGLMSPQEIAREFKKINSNLYTHNPHQEDFKEEI